ncbi:MAG: YfiR family protein [Proteobacteria bacterium]|nr:YfiR family protein [Pseudomonadota bacterium]
MSLKCHTYSVVSLLIFIVLGMPLAAFSLESSSENDIKAAYLYNFAKFVEWPKTAFGSVLSPVNVCVFGDDSLSDVLDSLENKTVAGRPMVIRHDGNLSAVEGCHILYICESEKKNLKKILADFGKKPVLTVSSVDNFAEQGGMIGFVRKGNNIRFEVNLDAVRLTGLSISSRLLKLAIIVDGHTDN